MVDLRSNATTMKDLLLQTSSEWTGLILRITAGFIMMPHGLQKTLGYFGGYGYRATVTYFTDSMKLPWVISILVIFFESFGAIGLITGFLTRIWAAGLIAVMIGAILTTNAKYGLFMNWSGTQSGEGYEYHVLFIGICVCLLISGGGKFSIDGNI